MLESYLILVAVSWIGWMIWFEVDYENWYTKHRKDRTITDSLYGWLVGLMFSLITPIALPFAIPYFTINKIIGLIGEYIRNKFYRREAE